MGKVGTEETLQKILNVTSAIAKNTADITSMSDVKAIVRAGMAKELFDIGDQIVVTWNDGSHDYECPFDVVAFHDVVRKSDGATVPGLWLQAHWLIPGVQFDGNEAFWHCDEALAAGTYNITMGNSWGSNVVSGKVYQFTLTQEVPAGGQLLFGLASSTTVGLPDQAPANWRVWSFASQTATEPIEKVTLTEGSSGTALGTLSSSTKYADTGVNNMQRASYGYNRWSQSGLRQYLNSDAAAGAWWTPQNVFDRPPSELTTKQGFMAGLPADFLDAVEEVKVTTALNTTSDSEIGTTEDTWDKFFIASLEQEYCVPQLNGAEGAYWPYWKERLGINSPQASGTAAALTEHIRYSIENHTSPQGARLRSAYRGHAYSTWTVTSTGAVGNGYSAAYSGRFAPACVIC